MRDNRERSTKGKEGFFTTFSNFRLCGFTKRWSKFEFQGIFLPSISRSNHLLVHSHLCRRNQGVAPWILHNVYHPCGESNQSLNQSLNRGTIMGFTRSPVPNENVAKGENYDLFSYYALRWLFESGMVA